MKPKICVSISPSNTTELVQNIKRAETLSADFVEVRFENLPRGLDIRRLDLPEKHRVPLIATNRRSSEKDIAVPEKDRLDRLFDAVDAGFQLVDVDLTTEDIERVTRKFREKNARIMLSTHDYGGTPEREDLDSTLAKISVYKPDICKLVTTARTPADNLTVLNLLEQNRQRIPLICLAMGKEGVWSRILAPFYGAPFTYACLERGMETAPGQPSISELRQIYNILGNG